MAIRDVVIEGGGLRIVTNNNQIYQGIFKFTSGGLIIEGVPLSIIDELLYHTNVDENVHRYTKYLLGDIKFGLGINILNIGDALTQNVWHEIPVTSLISNNTEINTVGNYIIN